MSIADAVVQLQAWSNLTGDLYKEHSLLADRAVLALNDAGARLEVKGPEAPWVLHPQLTLWRDDFKLRFLGHDEISARGNLENCVESVRPQVNLHIAKLKSAVAVLQAVVKVVGVP